MISRRDIGSWIVGTPGDPDYVIGSRLGIPPEGPGSLAGWGRRFGAIAIDWGLSLLISALFFDRSALANLVIFLVMTIVLVGFTGATIGHRIFGLRVVTVTYTWAPWLRGLVRGLLIALVIPVFVRDKDGRGLHDQGAGTALVTRFDTA